MSFPRFLMAVIGWGMSALASLAQDAEVEKSKLPSPDFANVAYGPQARNVLDIWLAKSTEPTPVVIYFHGGGFTVGGKENLPAPLLAAALKAGFSVVAANYRLSPDVKFPQHYLDCARVIQFVRHSARQWHLDPRRVALTGSSAGGATSLWLAFHDDLADAKSADVVEHESTRVSCAVVSSAQPTYDPRVVRALAGESAARHHVFTSFYGLKPEEADSPRAQALYREAAAITYLTPDDPPVFAYYSESRTPVPADAKPGTGIHHPNLGAYLKKQMDAAGVECVLRHRDEGGSVIAAEIAFLQKQFFPQPR